MTVHIDSKKLAAALQISEEEVLAILNGDLTPLAEQPAAALPPEEAIFFQEHNTTLYHADFLTSQALADESVDLIVTSPPYTSALSTVRTMMPTLMRHT